MRRACAVLTSAVVWQYITNLSPSVAGEESQPYGRYKATWKREIKLPWRGAGPLNHLSHDEVDPDRLVVNKELSLSALHPTP